MSQTTTNPTTGGALASSQVMAANPAATPVERKRIPMSVPTQRLAVPEMPGFHLYWFLGKNCPRAIQAGYDFVQADEVMLTESGVGSDRESADLGTRVSTMAGADMFDAAGQPERLYLMKIRKEWWDEDQKSREAKSDEFLAALKIGTAGQGAGQDNSNRYGGVQQTNIFKPPKRSM